MQEADERLSELGKAALSYVERGFAVFPIVPRRKFPPMFSDYYNLSSSDPDQVRAWWREVPEANIGLDCGKSGVIAVDQDTAQGHGAGAGASESILRAMKMLTGGAKAWDTTITQTPTGGRHYLFKAPDPKVGQIKTDSANFGVPGIDVRSRGGYIVLPPSSTHEGEYKTIAARPLRPFPRKLLAPADEGRRGPDGLTEVERRIKSGERVVEGSRDNFLTSIAGKLRDQGFVEEEIRAHIGATYRARCEPGKNPLTDKDFERIAASVCRYEPTKDVVGDTVDKVGGEESPGHFNRHDEAVAIPASNFLTESADPTLFVVEGLFQAYSLNQLVGAPKAGKSTLARHLALCVAYGLPFLGRFETMQSRVLYYSLQENKPHLRGWIKHALWGLKIAKEGEVPADMPIDFIFSLGNRGDKAIKGTFERIKDRHYGLVIIDMYGGYSGVSSLDDYAENQAITDALNDVAKRTGACIVWAHHERKSGGGMSGFEGGIGSQAIRGAVYTTMKHWKDAGRYYISTEQRDGDDLPATCVALDKTTLQLKAVGSHLRMEMADAMTRESRVRAVLARDPDLGIKEIRDEVGGRTRDIAALVDKIRHKESSETESNLRQA